MRPPRGVGFVMGVLLVVTSVGLVTAQSTVDPALQGRLLQRSDGSVYIYKDGLRYPVQPVDASDDDIDAIPLSAPVDRVDQLFVQVAPAAAAEPAAPAPVPNPAVPQPGTLLYQADWSSGPNGWALPADWQVAGGLLIETGTYTGVSVIAAP